MNIYTANIPDLSLPDKMSLALQGNIRARQEISRAYSSDDQENRKSILEMWKAAADAGNTYARNKVDEERQKDLGIPQLFELFDQGNQAAQWRLHDLDFRLREKDEGKVLYAGWALRASQGNPNAQYIHAFHHFNGDRTEQNVALGYEWLEKAADNGEIRSMAELASFVWNGFSQKGGPTLQRPRDKTRAMDLWLRSAEAGLGESQEALASRYSWTTDDWQFLKWMGRASQNNYPFTFQAAVGCYTHGQGVSPELKTEFMSGIHRLGHHGQEILKGADYSEDPRFLTFGDEGEAIFHFEDGSQNILIPTPSSPEVSAAALQKILGMSLS